MTEKYSELCAGIEKQLEHFKPIRGTWTDKKILHLPCKALKALFHFHNLLYLL